MKKIAQGKHREFVKHVTNHYMHVSTMFTAVMGACRLLATNRDASTTCLLVIHPNNEST
jgi:hypothetical protein